MELKIYEEVNKENIKDRIIRLKTKVRSRKPTILDYISSSSST